MGFSTNLPFPLVARDGEGKARSRLRPVFLLCAWLVVLLTLVGCTRLSRKGATTPFPTEYLPTFVAQTVEAGRPSETGPTASPGGPTLTPNGSVPTDQEAPTSTSANPSQTASPPKPSATSIPATATVTRTPTTTPTLVVPAAAIQILEPGSLSRLVSPFNARAYIKPGSDGKMRLELLGEDGRLLVRKVTTYDPSLTRVNVFEEIEFEINAVAEAARLQISTFDRYGRPLAMDSVDVVLLSMGEADVNPPGPPDEKIIIQEPLANKLIQGGKLFVSGLARTDGQQPLLVELLQADGKVVGYRLAAVDPDPAGGYGTFMAEVPYNVESPTWVRMTIREDSHNRIPGVVYLTSLELLLSP